MGQRMQIFLNVPNPKHTSNEHHKRVDNTFNILGKEKTTILPFHNQWLYGRSALRTAINVLTHTSQISEKDMFDPWSDYGYTPFTNRGIYSKFFELNTYITAIEHIMNFNPETTPYINAGYMTSWFLKDEYTEMSVNFTLGCNNDGVLIIDTINNKYCFMNIYEKSDEMVNSVSDLPQYKPVSAKEYVRAYYGEAKTKVSQFQIERYGLNEAIKLNKKHNRPLIKELSKYDVLTIDEIIKMFPECGKYFV